MIKNFKPLLSEIRVREKKKKEAEGQPLIPMVRPEAPPPPPLLYTVRSAEEILNLTLDPHDNLFGDRLLTKGGKLLIAGPLSIGKSRLLLELAACSILGKDWLGIPTHGEGLSWLILQTENSNWRLQHDLKVLVRQYGKEFLKYLRIQCIETDMDGIVGLQSSSSKIAQTIQAHQPAVVAIDPLRDFGVGDLSSDNDMTLTCSLLGQVIRLGNPQRALIILHHALTGKSGAVKATGWERAGYARNSKVLGSWVRGQINIAPGSADNNDTLVISCGRVSDGREFSPFAVQRNGTGVYEARPDFDFGEWQKEISSKGKAGFQKQYTVERAHAATPDFQGWTHKKLKEQITKGLKCSEYTAKKLITEGKEDGAWHQVAQTGLYTKDSSFGFD